MSLPRRAWRALTSNAAETSPDAADPRLRGRTYAVPFDAVWRAACALVDGGLPHVHLVESDDYQGSIRGRTEKYFAHPAARLRIRVLLDENAQTRVDAHAGSPGKRGDLGANARLIGRFFRALDEALADARPRSGAAESSAGGGRLRGDAGSGAGSATAARASNGSGSGTTASGTPA